MKKHNIHTSGIECVEDFKKNGIGALETMSEKKVVDFLREMNKVYYNEEKPMMTDTQYDIVKEYIEKKYPNNKVLREIGAPVEKQKVVLPYFMGSMDKIKPDTDALENWKKKYKGPYILSCKLDGISALYTTENGKEKLYSRGDGKIGQDISHLIKYLKLPKVNCVVIRGELILPKHVFESKYRTKFANSRNMVAGLVNQKKVDVAIQDVHFVAYEVIQPVLKPSKQFELLKSFEPNIESVLYKKTDVLDNKMLSETLVEWRQNYEYEIDGVIVCNDEIYERKEDNPEHAFAFKMVLYDQVAEAKVVDVLWTASKDGYLKPRVQIEPIRLCGVKIEYATGFNGSFIYKNKIGVGSVVQIIRSGDVIPHITKVLVPINEPKMPNVPYKWNASGVDIVLEDIENDENVNEKNITGFFQGIGVEGLSSGNIKRIVRGGYDSVAKIIAMQKEDFLKIEGFKDKTATKIQNGIQEKVKEAKLITIMDASNVFGRGFSEKKIELILKEEPTVLVSKEQQERKIQRITEIKGMARKSAEAFVERINDFMKFLKETHLEYKLQEIQKDENASKIVKNHELYGKTVVMSGFRDSVLQEKLKTLGVNVGSTVSSKTFVLLVKEMKEEDSGKIKDAKKHSIPIMMVGDFVEKYRMNK